MDAESPAGARGSRGRVPLRLGHLLIGSPLAPVVLLGVAFVLRVFGYDFDQGLLLHPDELFIVSKVTSLGCCLGNGPATWPNPFAHFFDATLAPYDPHSFNYGSLPFYVLAAATRAIAAVGGDVSGLHYWTTATGIVQTSWIGRWISALFDTGSVLLAYLIAGRIYDRAVALFAMFLAAFTVLSIQLSHFYAVDTLLGFFVLLTLYGAVRVTQEGRWWQYALMGAALGAGLATKTSAFPLVIPMGAAALFAAGGARLAHLKWSSGMWRRLPKAMTRLAASMLAAILVFFVCEPYGVIDHKQLNTDVQTQNGIIVGHNIGVPFTLQFTGTLPYVYYLKNMFLWYLGPALGVAAGCGFIWLLWRTLRLHSRPAEMVLLLWIVPYFAVIGKFWAKFGRYTLPLLPVLCILAAAFLFCSLRALSHRWRWLGRLGGAVVGIATLAWTLAFMNVYAQTNPQIAASNWLYAHLTPSTQFATEGAWDRSLPFCPPSDSCPAYSGIPLNLFDPDTPAKVDRIVYALTHVQYIVMSTQRFVDSIPKVASEYPITSNYYRLLFNDKLNFRLVKRFAVHPALGPWVIDDFPADENFTVFDHPDVRIFERTGPIAAGRAAYMLTHPITGSVPEWDGLPPAMTKSSAEASKRSSSFQVSNRIGLAGKALSARIAKGASARPPTTPLPPVNAGASVQDHRLMLNRSQWEEDQTAPTYDQMFPPHGFAAQHPIVIWFLLVELLGLAVFPITFFVFRGLGDRGWAVAKTAGLVLFAWLVFALVGLGWLSYGFGTVWLSVMAVVVLGLASALFQWRPLVGFARKRWRSIAVTEAVFLAGFITFLLLRMWYPDLGHQFSPVSTTNIGSGRMGEKQLELAFINAISRSKTFPPLDPFFAGGFINYYYFGYVIVSAVSRATMIPPATGFNLAIATFFGLLLATSFCVGRALTHSLRGGFFAALLVAVVGNLNGLIQLVEDVQTAAVLSLPVPFIGGVLEFFSGLVRVVFFRQAIPPFDFWASSRIVPPAGTDFAEFPYWTYLFGDLHAHLIAFPMDMAVVALSVSCMVYVKTRVAQSASLWTFLKENRGYTAGVVLLGGLLLGALEATNPLDFPTFAIILGLGMAAGLFGSRRILSRTRSAWQWIQAGSIVVVGTGLAAAIGVAIFPPLIQGYHPVFDSGLAPVQGAESAVAANLSGLPPFPKGAALSQAVHNAIVTPLPIFWETFGLFLFILLSWIVYLLSRPRRGPQAAAVRRPLQFAEAAGRNQVETAIGLVFLAGMVILAALDLWLLSFLLLMSGLMLVATFARRHQEPQVLWIAGAVLLALGLTAFTEIAYIRDYLAGGLAFRMNTVAKLYNQIWLLLAIAAAGALMLMTRAARLSKLVVMARQKLLLRLFLTALIFTMAASLIFTYSGTIARENYRQTWLPEDSVPPTLDGMAFMKVAYPGDYAGINWLNAHVRGTPIIVEADQAYYNWRSRVVQFTGLPTLYGGIYESAQRYPDEVAPRQTAVETIYGSTDANTSDASIRQLGFATCRGLNPGKCIAMRLLQAYHVSYVYVGLMEKQLWPAGVGKFNGMSGLRRVFHAGDVSIYHVSGSEA